MTFHAEVMSVSTLFIIFLPVALVCAGVVFLAISLFISGKVRFIVPQDVVVRWHVLAVLILFFIIGYIAYVVIQLLQVSFATELLTAAVFFGGAIFVYIIVSLAAMTARKLYHMNRDLEEIVEARTTELKQTNLNLEQSREEFERQSNFLKNILDALTHPFYVINVEDHSIALANSAANFNLSEAKTCHMLTHGTPVPCDGDSHPCPIIEIKRTGRPVTLEHKHVNAKGEIRFVEIHGYPIFDDHHKLVQIIEYTHDVTLRKQAEVALIEAKNEAMMANMSKSRFLANVSHEIRTPMNAIIGMTELALTTELDSRQRHCLKTVKESSDLLLNLINDILDYSKIEAERMQLDVRPFCVKGVLDVVVRSLQHMAEENGNEIQLLCKDEICMRELHGDDLRLRQILYNLIGNAIKFTRNGKIEIDVMSMAEKAGLVTLKFQVRDNGIGIAPDFFDSIFDSFSQADNSITRKHGGTGLGLSICKLLCQMMGGEIWLESEINRGTTFYFTAVFEAKGNVFFPYCKAESETDLAVSPKNILVVDDVIPNRELVRMLLERDGHIVEEATDGLNALQKMSLNDYDAVLLDIQMPVLDGLQTAQYIRRSEKGISIPEESEYEEILARLGRRVRGRHTPLMAMTAQAMRGDKEKCLEAGMDSYISKPIQLNDLRKELLALI